MRTANPPLLSGAAWSSPYHQGSPAASFSCMVTTASPRSVSSFTSTNVATIINGNVVSTRHS